MDSIKHQQHQEQRYIENKSQYVNTVPIKTYSGESKAGTFKCLSVRFTVKHLNT